MKVSLNVNKRSQINFEMMLLWNDVTVIKSNPIRYYWIMLYLFLIIVVIANSQIIYRSLIYLVYICNNNWIIKSILIGYFSNRRRIIRFWVILSRREEKNLNQSQFKCQKRAWLISSLVYTMVLIFFCCYCWYA